MVGWCTLPLDSSSSHPPSYTPQVCIQAVEALSAGQDVPEEDLMLLGQLPDATHGYGQFYSLLRSFLLPMKNDPVISLLTLKESQQQEVSLENLFEKAEKEDNADVRCSLWWHQDAMLYSKAFFNYIPNSQWR